METLGDRIRRFRKLKGLSQKRLADLSGVRQATIAELELNNQKSTKRLLEIAKGLGVAVTDLAPDMKELLDAVHGQGPEPLEGEFVVVGEDAPRLTSPAPKERTFKQQLADMRADSDEFQRAMAVVEGVVLAIGLKPEHLGEAREIIHEALESPLVLSTPDAELDVRRAMAQSNISRLLRKRKAQEDKE